MGEHSLFQSSVQRLSGPEFAAPLVVTGNDFRFTVLEQMAAVGAVPAQLLIEPTARNTAPAILAAALVLAQKDPAALMLVAPSDHVIPDTSGFSATVQAAVARAQAGDLVTFGIKPTRAETGYPSFCVGACFPSTMGAIKISARIIARPMCCFCI